MQAGLGIPTYVPKLLPSNPMLSSTVIPGDDVVAATGAGSEILLLHCPSCLEEYRKLDAIPLSPYSGAASVFMCTKVKIGRGAEGQAHPCGGRGGGTRQSRRRNPCLGHAHRGGRPAAAWRHRLRLRRARVAQDLCVRRLRQVRGRLSAGRAVTGHRLHDQPRGFPQAVARPQGRAPASGCPPHGCARDRQLHRQERGVLQGRARQQGRADGGRGQGLRRADGQVQGRRARAQRQGRQGFRRRRPGRHPGRLRQGHREVAGPVEGHRPRSREVYSKLDPAKL